MNATRRNLLAGAGGFVAVSILGETANAAPEMVRAGLGDVLFLCSDGLGQHDFAVRSRRDGEYRPIGHTVRVSTYDGFSTTTALLDGLRGVRVVALLNDADELVIDSLLTRHGARDRTTRRVANGALLLSATL